MNTSPTHHRLLILGSGPAGYTAAIYAARANLSPTLLTGMEIGGQLTTTTEVENFPGFPTGIQGPELMELMRTQAAHFGTKFIMELATAVDCSVRPFRITTDGGQTLTADALIVATGASAKYLGIESEKNYMNRGVSGCATCDGFFFRNKAVAVVGGGDTAAEEALYLANICESVTLVHRRDTLRASKVMADRVVKHPKITCAWNSAVDEVLGDETKVTGLRLKSTLDDSTRDITVQGVFIAIGHSPNTAVFGAELVKDDQGYIVTDGMSTATSVAGVFAAGDVADRVYRQAITSAGTGCKAAMDAERWLGEEG